MQSRGGLIVPPPHDSLVLGWQELAVLALVQFGSNIETQHCTATVPFGD